MDKNLIFIKIFISIWWWVVWIKSMKMWIWQMMILIIYFNILKLKTIILNVFFSKQFEWKKILMVFLIKWKKIKNFLFIKYFLILLIVFISIVSLIFWKNIFFLFIWLLKFWIRKKMKINKSHQNLRSFLNLIKSLKYLN